MPSTSSEKEDEILNYVKNTMGSILAKLDNQDNTTLNTFLKTKIKNLKMEKKELVGVFGKTGAGKTSLINTVIEEKMLLPSGSVDACTSVVTKVEANKCNGIYEAEIEFISPEEDNGSASLRQENGRNKEVRDLLDQTLSLQTESVRNEMAKITRAFEEHLQEGVEKSKSSYEEILRAALYPKGKSGRGFHKQLKKAVENGGIWKPKKGKEINLNMKLTSCLTESIDKLFRETFPKEGHCGPFNGAINNFTLGTDGLKQTYKDVELQLLFLKSEEDWLKTYLSKTILKLKKTVFTSLIKTIEETMQDCYKKAAVISGTGTLLKMQETIEKHVLDSKDNMFENAKNVMMNQLDNLMMAILRGLEDRMKEAIEVSLGTDNQSIPDVSEEFEFVQRLYDELLQISQNKGTL
ncbi:PREDICTED: uncharacterized protein LOC107092525 [Cyprinodon variegatus]|uniref:uncharacterized protein LOC107092525 n=1 Tax=Cyprinodon variegatus TaxID=28743 RepID=UPI000742C9F4|nr:PREDICTED: uncharacterized protein LOC107092525 [Cyprinodon variegatus]